MSKHNSADLIKEIFVNRVYLNGNIFWWSSNLSVDTIMEDISKTQTNKNMKIMYLIVCNIKILICFYDIHHIQSYFDCICCHNFIQETFYILKDTIFNYN